MRNSFHLFSILILGLTLTACGGSSGGGGDSDEDPIADVSGTWDITETMGSNTCEEIPGTIENYEVTVTMSGNSVTVVTPAGTFTGSLDGDELEWTGSYPEDGGTTTITSMDLTVSADGNTLSGTTRWSWTDGNVTCTGRTSVSGVRTSGPPLGGGGTTVVDTEPNDTAPQSNTISSAPATMTGNINAVGFPPPPTGPDPFDSYLFIPSTTRNYTVTLTPVSNDADLYVFNATPVQLASSVLAGTATETINITLNAGETYYILVVGAGGNTAYSATLD